MHILVNYLWVKILALGILVVYVIFNIPFITHFSFRPEVWTELFSSNDGLQIPILRTLALSFFQALTLIVVGITGAILLNQIKLKSPVSKYLGTLLIPIVLGNVSVAFLFKLLLLEQEWAFSGPVIKFLILTWIQIWQYGSLFIYLFWLNQQTIPQPIWDYASAIKLNSYEQIKDILLPVQRNLSMLLFIVAFVFCYYEDSKIQFIFRASRGTDTELVNQWLNRSYNSDTLINANFAFLHLSQAAVIILLAGLLVLVVTLFLIHNFFQTWIRSKTTLNLKLLPTNNVSQIFALLLVSWVFAPVIVTFYLKWSSFAPSIQALIPTLALTALAALIVTAVTVSFGILSRLAWQKHLSTFNIGSMAFLLILFSLVLVPPITLLLLGFKWMQVIGYSSPNTIYIAWVTGHTFLSFPILASFSIATHFRVKNTFIQFLEAHQTSLLEKLRDLFFKPFQADYLFTFLLAFAMIWNEGIINNVLSDVIPSFVTELNKTITGKTADYASGMNYLLISLLLAFGSAFLWSIIIHKYQNSLSKS